jgi:hypothetical protein
MGNVGRNLVDVPDHQSHLCCSLRNSMLQLFNRNLAPILLATANNH